MANKGELSVLTLGGKGSSLSSSSVYVVAIGRAQVRLDSSALDRLMALSSNQKRPPSLSFKHRITVPMFLTQVEKKAFLVVLLNKFLLSNSPGVCRFLPELIAEMLNSKLRNLEFEEVDVTKEELFVLKNSSSTLLGISGILDHQSRALSTFADVVAAVSCEALKADITAFELMDSGDGHISKEEVGVASDMKVFVKDSKFVGKVMIESVSKIS